MTGPLSRKYLPTRFTLPPQQPQMHCQYVSYYTPPLHWRGVACVPMTADGDFVVAPDVVGEAKVRTSMFGIGR